MAAPIVREHFTILADGTVQVTKPLNFEKIRELSETIEIDGKKKCTLSLHYSARFLHFSVIDFLPDIGSVRDFIDVARAIDSRFMSAL